MSEDPRFGEIRAVLNSWNLGNITEDALIALDEIHAILDRPASTTPSLTRVLFQGGPWDQLNIELERVVAPVFSPAHEVGRNYWLDTKGAPGQLPTYHWREN